MLQKKERSQRRCWPGVVRQPWSSGSWVITDRVTWHTEKNISLVMIVRAAVPTRIRGMDCIVQPEKRRFCMTSKPCCEKFSEIPKIVITYPEIPPKFLPCSSQSNLQARSQICEITPKNPHLFQYAWWVHHRNNQGLCLCSLQARLRHSHHRAGSRPSHEDRFPPDE